MIVLDEQQFSRLMAGLDRIGGALDQLTSCIGGINYAINNQTDAIRDLRDNIAAPIQKMQEDLDEIRDGVNDLR